jgi:lysophospholipase L1-like esterase
MPSGREDLILALRGILRLATYAGLFGLTTAAVFGGIHYVYSARKLKSLEPARLDGQTQTAGSGQCRLLLVGDSRISRWPLKPIEGWTVGKLGYPGAVAPNIAASAKEHLASFAPLVVLIQAGANDVIAASFQPEAEARTTLARTDEAISRLSEDARAVGAQTVVVLTVVPPIRLEAWKVAILRDRPYRLLAELNPRLAEEARIRGDVLLDADRLFRDSDGRLQDSYRDEDNSTHWSAVGYASIEEALRSVYDISKCYRSDSAPQ